MDDRSKGVARGDDMSGRASEDITGRGSEEFTRRSTESIGDYGASIEADVAPSSDATDVDPRTNEIRRDIEQTRDEMSETIDAIQDKLRPANIVSSATERVKQATTERVRQMTQLAGDAADRMMYGRGSSEGVMGGIRQNPIPAALIGIGAAWLYMSSRSESRRDGRDRFDERYRGAGDYTDLDRRDDDYRAAYASYSSRATEGGGFLDRVKSNPVPAALAGLGLGWLAMAGSREHEGESGAYGRAGTRDTGESGEGFSVSNAASGVAESAQQMTSGAQEYTREAAQRVRQTGRRAQSQLERLSRENPLAVGAGALLLGAAVGLALPETERENELMGETRDEMVDRAQDMARNAASRAQDAAADLAGEAASRAIKGSE